MTSVHRLIHLWAAVTWLDVIKNWAGSGGWRGVEVSEKAMRIRRNRCRDTHEGFCDGTWLLGLPIVGTIAPVSYLGLVKREP
jgi:hypothetical protein